jgi:hypothetical protein
VKWYKKLALYIINVVLLSACAPYLIQNEKGMSLHDFQMSVIRGLLEIHKERRINQVDGRRCIHMTKKFKQMLSARKLMGTVFWDRK